MATSLLPEERALTTLHTIALAIRPERTCLDEPGNLAGEGSDKFMEKELFDDPAINTRQDKLDRLKTFKRCAPKVLSLRSKVWSKLKK